MTDPAPLPRIAVAVRAFLLDDEPFMTACDGRVSTRAPGDVTRPYALVRATSVPSRDGGGILYKPFVQVDGFAPPGSETDPETVAWDIAAAAAAAFRRARNLTHETIVWSARVTDLQDGLTDTSRGQDKPLYRALARAELTVHAH